VRVVVTGGSGMVGRALVRRLIARGHSVRVLTRDEQRARARLPLRCEVATWSPSETTVASILFAGVDAVVNLAGEGIAAGRWNKARKQAVLDSRVEGTRAIVNTIARLPASERPRVLVSASATGFYGNRRGETLSEDKIAGGGFLADVCRAWEAAARPAEELGVRTVRMRIGIVLDAQGGALARMLPAFRAGLGGRLGNGRQWMSWIHIDDLVSLLLFVIANNDASGAINAVAPTPVTNAAFTRGLASSLRRPALLPLPAAMLRVGLGEMSALLLASQRVAPVVAERLGFVWTYADLRAALSALSTRLGSVIESEQYVERNLEEVCSFCSDPRVLERLTPPKMQLRFLGVKPVGPVGKGSRFKYRTRIAGIGITSRSKVTAWQPPHSFVDAQVSGPYNRWVHTHEFEEYRGGTIIRDHLLYDLRFNPLGSVLAGRAVARSLAEIFAYRRGVIAELMGSPAVPLP